MLNIIYCVRHCLNLSMVKNRFSKEFPGDCEPLSDSSDVLRPMIAQPYYEKRGPWFDYENNSE